nr:zinc-ribbon domain-containing protein [uncultured Methanobrevibacter sp.]
MIKCSKCGKENVDDAIFCADCGTKLDNGPSALSTDIETDDSSSDSIWSLFKIRKAINFYIGDFNS